MKIHSKSNPWKLYALLLAASPLLLETALSAPAKADGTDNAKKVAVSEKRDPFWPVGYVPERIKNAALSKSKTVQKKQEGNAGWKLAMKQVVINGVSSRSDDEFFAVINGQIKTVGDTIKVTQGMTVYTWALDSITPPSSVKLRRVSAQ